jgi:hypothetical protein
MSERIFATITVASTLPQQEQQTAENVWAEISPAARQSIEAVRFTTIS